MSAKRYECPNVVLVRGRMGATIRAAWVMSDWFMLSMPMIKSGELSRRRGKPYRSMVTALASIEGLELRKSPLVLGNVRDFGPRVDYPIIYGRTRDLVCPRFLGDEVSMFPIEDLVLGRSGEIVGWLIAHEKLAAFRRDACSDGADVGALAIEGLAIRLETIPEETLASIREDVESERLRVHGER